MRIQPESEPISSKREQAYKSEFSDVPMPRIRQVSELSKESAETLRPEKGKSFWRVWWLEMVCILVSLVAFAGKSTTMRIASVSDHTTCSDATASHV